MSDLYTIYCLTDEKGQDAFSVIISSEHGTVFNEDTEIESTICTCRVYEGVREVTPLSYEWQIIDNDTGDWVTIGHDKTISIPINPSIIRKRVRCLVNVEPSSPVLLSDENLDLLTNEKDQKLYSMQYASDVPETGIQNITEVPSISVLSQDDSIFVNNAGMLKQIPVNTFVETITNSLSYQAITDTEIDALFDKIF